MNQKRCFVIMPISECIEYPQGHFARVYDHIITPACELAGFKPIRADDIMTTNYIAIDIIKNILECEMAICDLSSRNPNVLYELGIRQSFNLPVTLIKDYKTNRIFDIQGFRDIEYDESLRIDTVQDAIESIAEVIKNTYNNKSSEINSLISLLGIEPAKITDKRKISTDTELLLNAINSIENRIRIIEKNKISQNINELSHKASFIQTSLGEPITQKDIDDLKVGDLIFHKKFGHGKIIEIINDNDIKNKKSNIEFVDGVKTIILRFGMNMIYKYNNKTKSMV